ncbi:MAG: L,D-transpeptidase family protein [Gammaproteobacteria bacterium]
MRVRFATPILLSLLLLSGSALAEVRDPVPSHVFELAEGQNVVGELQRIRAREEDTFADLARLFDLGYDELGAANPGIDPWLPGAGTEILLPTQFILPDAPRDGVVLNLAAMRLFYFPPADKHGKRKVFTHPIGIGRVGWSTPLGSTKVTAKATNPAWYVPKSVLEEHAADGDPLPPVVPPGPDNPLGQHVLRLGMPSYLIHGTNKPWGVGMRVSHGCIRLYPEDIAELYRIVPVGTPVHIVEQPYLAGWVGKELVFSARLPLEESGGDWLAALELVDAQLNSVADKSGKPEVDWGRLARITREGQGIPLPIVAGSEDPQEWVEQAPLVRPVAVANYQPPAEEVPPEG